MIKQQRAEDKVRATQAIAASQPQARPDGKSVGDSNETDRRAASQVQAVSAPPAIQTLIGQPVYSAGGIDQSATMEVSVSTRPASSPAESPS